VTSKIWHLLWQEYFLLILACEYCDFEDLASLVARVLSSNVGMWLLWLRRFGISCGKSTFFYFLFITFFDFFAQCVRKSYEVSRPLSPSSPVAITLVFHFLPVSQAHNMSMNVCEYASASLFPHIWLQSFIFVHNVGKSRKNVGYDKRTSLPNERL